MNAHVGANGIECRPDDTTVHGLHFPKTTLNMGKLPMPGPATLLIAVSLELSRRVLAPVRETRSTRKDCPHYVVKDSGTHKVGQIALGRSVLLAWEAASDGQRSTRRNYGRHSVESHS